MIMNLERDIIRALRQVYDPEIPVNVYDLGLIYEIRVNEEHETCPTGTSSCAAKAVTVSK